MTWRPRTDGFRDSPFGPRMIPPCSALLDGANQLAQLRGEEPQLPTLGLRLGCIAPRPIGTIALAFGPEIPLPSRPAVTASGGYSR